MIYFLYPEKNRLEKGMKELGSQIRREAGRNKVMEVKVVQARRMKTTAQNAYYHALLTLVCKHTGEQKLRLRTTIKEKLGYYDEVWINGESRIVHKSMGDVTLEQSNLFITTIQDICIYLNLDYPDPSEFYSTIGFKKWKEEQVEDINCNTITATIC